MTRSRASARLNSPCTTIGSAIALPTVLRGLRLANGSWKIICMRRRTARSPARSSVRTSWPSNSTRPRARLDEAQDRARGRRLAAAAFADQRERFAGAQRKRDVLDGVHARAHAAQHAGADVEARHEIGDLEHGTLGDRRRRRHVGDALGLAGDGIDDREALRVGTALHRAEARDRGEQRAGVGLARRCEESRGRRLLDGVAVQHDDGAVGDLRDDAHVVRDEHHRHAFLVLQRLDELEDLGLDGDVERGGRLVGDEQRRLAGERHGDHHALAHAAGEPMRIFVQARSRRRNAHALEDAQRLGLRLRAIEGRGGRRALRAIWKPSVSTGLRLVIGSWKIIEMRLPRTLRISSFAQRQEVAAFERDIAGDAAVGGGQQPHDRQRRHALAGARFADDGDRLARRDVERDALDDGGPHAVDAERGREVAHGRRDRGAHVTPVPKGRPNGLGGQRAQRAWGRHVSPLSFGSMASRRPSPSRFSAKMTTRIAMLGTSASE